MLRTIKLIIYYFAYQILFILIAGIIHALPALAAGEEGITALLNPGPVLLSYAIFGSSLLMMWHLLHFKYVELRLRSWRDIPLSVYLFSILLILCVQFVCSIGNEWLGVDDLNKGLFRGMSRNPVGAFSLAVLVPILEELFFRGAIMGHFMHRGWRPWVAITVSALIFGILHGNPAQIPFAFFIGLLFGWLYYRLRSLLPSMIGHILNNTYGVIGLYLQSDSEAAAGLSEQWGVETTYVVFFASLAGIGLFTYLVHRYTLRNLHSWHTDTDTPHPSTAHDSSAHDA